MPLDIDNLQFNLIEGYDADLDVTLAEAIAALAAMIGRTLEYRGLDPRYSHSLPPEQVPLDTESGPAAVHLPSGARPVDIAVYDSCLVRLTYTVRSYYFIAPIQEDRAAAWGATEDWLIPILRAQFANQTLGGICERCVPTAAEWVGEMAYGESVYTGLVITSALYINYEWPQG